MFVSRILITTRITSYNVCYTKLLRNEISSGLRAGEVTDDTEFTMIISQLLFDNNGIIDPQKFVDKIKLWATTDEKSKTVLGPSTKRAISEIDEGQPIEYAGSRITSYNVCYTKLLRNQRSKQITEEQAIDLLVHESSASVLGKNL